MSWPSVQFPSCSGSNLGNRFNRSWLAFVAATLILVAAASFPGFAQTQDQAPSPVRSHTEETLDLWNAIGNKLVAMAQDFPEDKYDYKMQKDERTFALNLLHAAALDYVVIRKVAGSNDIGPDFGQGDNPTRDQFKTKADVVKFVQGAIADGAKVIQQQGDAGLDGTTKFGKRLLHNSHIWSFAIEHSAEHYGQLVVYYRANGLVPPASRQ
jgi:uncharacterized damage-inducible protein DinB